MQLLSSRRGFIPRLAILKSVVGIGMLSLFVLMDSMLLKIIFLSIGVAMTLSAVSNWLNLIYISLPGGHFKRLSGSSGALAGSIYYIAHGQTTVWVALAWVLIIFGVWATVTVIQRILVETALLRKLLRAYEEEVVPKLPVPFAYIHAEPGPGVFVAQRLVAKVMNSLWEYQFLSSKSGLTVYLTPGRVNSWHTRYLWRMRQRVMMLFIVSDSLRQYTIDFRRWLASQAAAFITLRTSTARGGSCDESFEEEANSGYKKCLGPTFTILVHLLGKGEFPSSPQGDEVIECSWSLQNRSLESVIAPLSNRLASNAVPIIASDSRLDTEMRLAIPEIAARALPMVANSYLRFRLAQSDVERFLSLLDCIESVIRSSVVVLLINRWLKKGEDIGDNRLIGKPLTLGAWVSLLENLTELTIEDELDKEICHAWKKETSQTQNQLINKVREIGLYSVNCQGSSQLDWLRWLTDLRNVTRGHGVIDETSLAPLWHSIHKIFLQIVSVLRSLIISSYLVVYEPNGREVILRGWSRGKFHYDLVDKFSGQETLAFLKSPSNRELPLYPLIVVKENDILIFDHLQKKEKAIDYLDCRSGTHKQLLLPGSPDIDPYIVWSSKKGER